MESQFRKPKKPQPKTTILGRNTGRHILCIIHAGQIFPVGYAAHSRGRLAPLLGAGAPLAAGENRSYNPRRKQRG